MITLDQCLTQLLGLADTDSEKALSLAVGYIEVFVPLVRADRIKGARLLTELRGNFSRRAHPSPLTSDILDFLDARIVRLLDSADELDDS